MRPWAAVDEITSLGCNAVALQPRHGGPETFDAFVAGVHDAMRTRGAARTSTLLITTPARDRQAVAEFTGADSDRSSESRSRVSLLTQKIVGLVAETGGS